MKFTVGDRVEAQIELILSEWHGSPQRVELGWRTGTISDCIESYDGLYGIVLDCGNLTFACEEVIKLLGDW